MAETLAAIAIAACAGLLCLLRAARRRAREADAMAERASRQRDIAEADARAWQKRHDEQRAMTTRAQNNAIDLAKKLGQRKTN